MIDLIATVVFHTSASNLCYALDKSPTTQTITWWVVENANGDFSEANGKRLGDIAVSQLQSQCPEYIPLALLWAEQVK